MTQINIIIERLKKPTVIISLISQIVGILILLDVNIDSEAITGIATSVTAILVTLGILSNPDTVTSGYGDDIAYCEGCEEEKSHVAIGGELYCSDCGTKLETTTEAV